LVDRTIRRRPRSADISDHHKLGVSCIVPPKGFQLFTRLKPRQRTAADFASTCRTSIQWLPGVRSSSQGESRYNTGRSHEPWQDEASMSRSQRETSGRTQLSDKTALLSSAPSRQMQEFPSFGSSTHDFGRRYAHYAAHVRTSTWPAVLAFRLDGLTMPRGQWARVSSSSQPATRMPCTRFRHSRSDGNAGGT
jgi:hypothetical protein